MTDEALTAAVKAASDKLVDVVFKHIRAVDGFSLHPVYCDVTAYEPIAEILKEFLAAHASAVLGHARNLIEAFSEQLDDWGHIGGVGTWPQAEQFVRDGKAIVDLVSAQAARIEEVEYVLENLHALVLGESPRLLNEDSGGDGELSIRIKAVLARSEPRA